MIVGFTGWVAVFPPGGDPTKYYGRVLGKRLIVLLLVTGFALFLVLVSF